MLNLKLSSSIGCKIRLHCVASILVPLVACTALANSCPHRHKLGKDETLKSVSEFYFGDANFWPAVLLATNSQRAEFSFISDPQDLRTISAVCVPEIGEALALVARFNRYESAVSEAMTPHATVPSPDLEAFPDHKAVALVTWIREGEVASYKDYPRTKDVWVTVEPKLRDFCSEYLTGHSLDELTLRLEQRLGLPPGSGKSTFVRIRIKDPNLKTIFRPCSDPSTSHAHCEAAPPAKEQSPEFKDWFFRQYYSSFATAKPFRYPWTTLGYTFDWASPSDGEAFARVGESEFVIPANAPIEVIETLSTAQYCSNFSDANSKTASIRP